MAPKLGGSVVSDCGDTRPASGTPGDEPGVGDTKQTFFCQPEVIMSGAQLVCEPLPPSAPNIDSKFVVDVYSDRAEEGSCLVSGARGLSVWTCMTNDYLIDDGLTTGETAGVRRPEPWWLSPVGYRAHRTTVAVSVTVVEEKALMVRMRRPRVDGTKAPLPRFTILLRTPRSAVLPPVPLASASHDGDDLAFQEEGTTTCKEDCEVKSRVDSIDHSDRPPRRLHFRRCGLAVPHLRHDDRVAVFCQHPRPERNGLTRPIAQTRLSAGLASRVALLTQACLWRQV